MFGHKEDPQQMRMMKWWNGEEKQGEMMGKGIGKCTIYARRSNVNISEYYIALHMCFPSMIQRVMRFKVQKCVHVKWIWTVALSWYFVKSTVIKQQNNVSAQWHHWQQQSVIGSPSVISTSLLFCFISESLFDSAEPQTSRRQSQAFILCSRSFFTLHRPQRRLCCLSRLVTKASWMHRTPEHPLKNKVFIKICSEAHGK